MTEMKERPLINSEVSAGIAVINEGYGSYSWKIYLLFGMHIRNEDYYVAARWQYASPASAKSAAVRWCRKLNLGIEFVEVT